MTTRVTTGLKMATDRDYDIIVYGASGFTGKLVALEVAKTFEAEGRTCAIAGRSRDKLETVLTDMRQQTGIVTFYLI